jgi:uncharacterized protein YukJ
MAGLDKGYGVLCGRVIQARTERDDTRSPHFQILVHAAGESFRVAVNVQSVDGSELVYYLDEDFRHPALDLLLETEEGFTRLESAAGGLALDYIRGNHFAPADMRELPADVGGPDNDLNDLLEAHVGRAVTDPEAILFAFGEPWGPDPGKDKVFRFSPNRGIHNIHQNQGNSGNFAGENGVWQDGGLMLWFPRPRRLVALFLKFQTQSSHTDDHTGHPIDGDTGAETPPTGRPATVRIVGARPRAAGTLPTGVAIMNVSDDTLSLNGWQLVFGRSGSTALDGSLAPGETRFFATDPARFARKGGPISLINAAGLKVDGVNYGRRDAGLAGWIELF